MECGSIYLWGKSMVEISDLLSETKYHDFT